MRNKLKKLLMAGMVCMMLLGGIHWNYEWISMDSGISVLCEEAQAAKVKN